MNILFLPPLDRAIVLFSLIWIVWMWNFPAPARLADLVTGFLNLGVVLLFLFTYTSWKVQGAGLPFNNSWLDDWVWELASLLIVLTGMALLLFTRPTGWGFGLGMLSLCLAGLAADVFITLPGGDFSGYIRLGQLAAFPLLTILLTRAAGRNNQPGSIADLERNAHHPIGLSPAAGTTAVQHRPAHFTCLVGSYQCNRA